MESSNKKRCFGTGIPIYEEYHDKEWGVPVYDDRLLFEMLILEGAHAGLSWLTVLKKRENYKRIFHNFDVLRVSKMTDKELNEALTDKGIIRNRLKVFSTRKNALVFIQIQKEYGSFSNYLWGKVNNKQIVNHWKTPNEMPATSDLSEQISKELKKKGMSFVGGTIMYAYLQAIGVIDDHYEDCFIRKDRK